jgi:adenylosuccinate lyase
MEKDLRMPGHWRYQPKDLMPVFGKDNFYISAIEVELAVMEVLGELAVIPPETMKLLTPEVKEKLFEITTTEVDRVEFEETEFGPPTKHDIRALVRVMQARMPESLRKYVHIPLTSYDVLSTAFALMFKRAQQTVIARFLACYYCRSYRV